MKNRNSQKFCLKTLYTTNNFQLEEVKTYTSPITSVSRKLKLPGAIKQPTYELLLLLISCFLSSPHSPTASKHFTRAAASVLHDQCQRRRFIGNGSPGFNRPYASRGLRQRGGKERDDD